MTFYGRPESELLQLTSTEALFATDFQFDPVKATIAFFIAETIRKCVHEFDADGVLFSFLRERVAILNETEDLGHFPVNFLIDFTEILGIQPLVNDKAIAFDLDEGNIGSYVPMGHRSIDGAAVQGIVKRIEGHAIALDKSTRDQALKAMMEYYTIHVPGLREFETYPIVQEILS